MEDSLIDEIKLNGFVHRALGDLGSALTASLVVIGDKLGLYRAMAMAGPVTAAELAARTDTTERSVREWLAAQAAAGYVEYDPQTGRYMPPAEHAVALTTLVCTQASLDQEVGTALGAQAGEARLRDLVTGAGFSLFRRATATPFNLVFEARP